MKLKILDQNGHTEFDLKPQETLEKIQQVDPAYWGFIDGIYIDRKQITFSVLSSASEVVLTPQLQAG